MFVPQFSSEMFSITKKSEAGFSIIVLKDEISGSYAEVLPGNGATLHAYGINNDDHRVQIIDHYKTEEEFSNSVEKLGFKGCKLSPFVCRLKYGRYSFGGKQYKMQYLRDGKHAIHGLIYKKHYQIIEETADNSRATVKMKYSYNKEDDGYPFSYDCIVSYTLTEGNTLMVKTECINTSGEAIPIQDGWHPYFNLGKKVDDIEMEFQSKEQYVFNEEILPTGETTPYNDFITHRKIGSIQLDNSFLLDFQRPQPMCVLRNRESGLELQILPEKSYPVLQIYIPPHRNSIAIENLSGPPDAFNLGKGFITLQTGKSAIFETAYRLNFI